MKFKLTHLKIFDYKPTITEFEGTLEEFNKIIEIGFVTKVLNDSKQEK